MAYLSAHGTMKPPLGAQIDPAHPFAAGLLVALGFQDFNPTASAGNPALTALLPGGSIANQTVTLSGGALTGMALTSNREGTSLTTTTSSGTIAVGSTGTWLPTTACTIAIIRRMNTATPGSNRFVHVGTQLIACYMPYSDGTVYWDYAGTSAPNRLTKAGLTISTTIPDHWVFTAGSQGSAIWQNGVKVASQATAISRAAAGDVLTLNYDAENADVNFFQISNVQWSDDLCRWWSAEPYAHLYPRPMTFVGSSKGKGKLPAAVVAAAAAAAASAAPTGLLTTTGAG